MIALDTNILVYAHRAGSPEHDKAKVAVLKAVEDSRGWGISLPTIPEFWSIVTHPQIPGGTSSAQVITQFFYYLLNEGNGELWGPGSGFAQRLMQLANRHKVRGRRIYDLQIAAIAHEHGASEIWTHDRSFISVPGLKVCDPLE